MLASETKPSLKIVGLHVEGFRALRRVDWPADGIGWGDTVPDIVMVGGVNGSGKTTLLELIAEAAQCILVRGHRSAIALPTTPLLIHLELVRASTGRATYSWTSGTKVAERKERFGPTVRYRQDSFDASFVTKDALENTRDTISIIADPVTFAQSDIPSVIYLPTDRRLEIPPETYKAAGQLTPHDTFFYRFKPSTSWKESLEAVLYSARWADLNAKDEGHPEQATHFESYARAFQAFFGETKRLIWKGGELFVEIADTGALHPLMELSSGEKQALILAAELYRRWRPGSLILIDEPELHFHTSWQTALYTMLERWQKERGGQIIIATQSTHLFSIATPGTTVLLGGPLA